MPRSLGIIAGIVVEPPAANLEDPLRQGVQEMAVMGDDEKRPAVLEQGVLHRVLRSRWFVGSSRIRRLVSASMSLKRARRAFSPPDRTDTRLWMSSPENRNAPSRLRRPTSFRTEGADRASSHMVWE